MQRGKGKQLWIYFPTRGKNWPWMNEWDHFSRQEPFPALEIIVPVGGYCYGGEVGMVSMKISLRKWKCLPWLELGPPLSWSMSRWGLGDWPWPAWTQGDPHGPGSVTCPNRFFGWRPREEEGKQRKERHVRNEAALPVNSWSQGHKVADAMNVHKKWAWWNPPKHNTSLRLKNKKKDFIWTLN